LLNVYEHWIRSGKSSRFCWDNYLNGQTLGMIEKMKSQLEMILVQDLKFDTNNKQCNRNSHQTEIIRAVLTCGLFPNLIYVSYDSIKNKNQYKQQQKKDVQN